MSLIRWIKGEEPSIIEKIGFVITHNGDTGAYGEYLTMYLFGNGNIDGYFKVLQNIYIPYRGKTSEIDILLIHEKGIFVFESKNYSGWIFGNENQTQWTQVINKNTKNRFYNPIKQNQTHIKALSAYLHLDINLMNSIIVFSERCELKSVPNNTESFTILQRHHLLNELKHQLRTRPTLLTPDEILTIYTSLIPLTGVSDDVKQAHIDTIQHQYK